MRVKGCGGGLLGKGEKRGGKSEKAVEAGDLESGGGMRNAGCSGEMNRYQVEHGWRRQHTGEQMTLRYESVGIEQD